MKWCRECALPGLVVVVMALGSLGLSGCGPLIEVSGSAESPSGFYQLSASTSSLRARPVSLPNAVLVAVDEPNIPKALSTDRIAVKAGEREIRYLRGARWADRAPRMLQNVVATSLSDGTNVIALGTGALDVRVDYRLKLDVHAFEAEYFRNPSEPTVRVSFRAQLVNNTNGRIVTVADFNATSASADTAASGVVDAFDRALADLLREMRAWLVHSVMTTQSVPASRASGFGSQWSGTQRPPELGTRGRHRQTLAKQHA